MPLGKIPVRALSPVLVHQLARKKSKITTRKLMPNSHIKHAVMSDHRTRDNNALCSPRSEPSS
jgi:hypothetical protein